MKAYETWGCVGVLKRDQVYPPPPPPPPLPLSPVGQISQESGRKYWARLEVKTSLLFPSAFRLRVWDLADSVYQPSSYAL